MTTYASTAETFLGAKVRDRLTGFEGYAIAYIPNIYTAAITFGLSHSKDVKGELGKAHSFDEQRVEILEPPAALFGRAPRSDKPGGPAINHDRE